MFTVYLTPSLSMTFKTIDSEGASLCIVGVKKVMMPSTFGIITLINMLADQYKTAIYLKKTLRKAK